MDPFTYNIPVKVHFGKDQLSKLPEELARYGKRVLLVYGGGSIKKTGLYDKIMKELSDFTVIEMSGIEPNPRVESVRKGAALCKEHDIDVILAVGGGSVIDASKWIAAGAKADHDVWDFFSKGAVVSDALPIVDVLTMAATGSEMDCIGVISNPETNDKMGGRDSKLFPKVSFLDPTLTYTVSKFQTACGAADILSHTMETYFNMHEDLYFLDTVMEGLMKTVIRYAPMAMKEPDNYEARANLMWAASWAINGFVDGGRKRAWSCHPMEHQLSARYDITHGLGLAILTPRWLKYCLNETTLPKYVQFGVNVLGIDADLPPMEIANKAIDALSDFLFHDLGLTNNLTDLGIDDSLFEPMAEKATANHKLAGAFKPLEKEDVIQIYNMCL